MSFKLSDLDPNDMDVETTLIAGRISEGLVKIRDNNREKSKDEITLELSKDYEALAERLRDQHELYAGILESASLVRRSITDQEISRHDLHWPNTRHEAYWREYKYLKDIKAPDDTEFLVFKKEFLEFCVATSMGQCSPINRVILAGWAKDLGAEKSRTDLANGIAYYEQGYEDDSVLFLRRSLVTNLHDLLKQRDERKFKDFMKAAATLYKIYDKQIDPVEASGEHKIQSLLLNTMMIFPRAAQWAIPHFNNSRDFGMRDYRPDLHIEAHFDARDMEEALIPDRRLARELEYMAYMAESDKEKSKFLSLEAYYHYFTGDKYAAYDAVEERIAITPKAYIQKGQMLKWDGRYEAAEAALNQALHNVEEAPVATVKNLADVWREHAQQRFDVGDVQGGLKLAFQGMEYDRMLQTGRRPVHPKPEVSSVSPA